MYCLLLFFIICSGLLLFFFKFLVPVENMATINNSAIVIEGVSRSRNALLNGDTKSYDWDSGYTCHQLGSGSIVVQLSQPYVVSSMRYVLHLFPQPSIPPSQPSNDLSASVLAPNFTKNYSNVSPLSSLILRQPQPPIPQTHASSTKLHNKMT